MSVLGLPLESLALFALAVLLLALTPGPVWIYLISRTLTQGRRAGYFSLIGVMAGVLVHLFAAALGLSALLLALPAAFDAVKLAGAAYLLWLAWGTLRGGGFSFTPQPLEPVPDRVLFRQSLTASVVNPKVAVFYLSLFPQFLDRVAVFAHGMVQLGVGGVREVDVERCHPALDVDVADDHGVVGELDQAGAHLEQFPQQRRREACPR